MSKPEGENENREANGDLDAVKIELNNKNNNQGGERIMMSSRIFCHYGMLTLLYYYIFMF